MTDHKELRKLAMDAEAHRLATNQDWDAMKASEERFTAAASPSVVIALLDEIEGLTPQSKSGRSAIKFAGKCRPDCHAKPSAAVGPCHTMFCPVRDVAMPPRTAKEEG